MQASKKAILFFSFLILFFSEKNIQANQEQDTLKQPDTIIYCFKYSFNPGDTLVYLVHSYDSIIIDYGLPLLKVRNEILRVICENITKYNSFILSIELIEFRGRDFQDTNLVEYNESDWKNRKVKIEIDSLGNRLNFWVDDSTISGRTPGGPFQPHLFFAFNETCKKKNETWLVRTTEDLVENGIPIPRLSHSMLFRMIGEVDTLGEKVARCEFIRTGQGSLQLQHMQNNLKVTSIINAYGYLDISKEKGTPLHLFTTEEQKLSFSSENTQSTGKHFIHTNYTLIEYRKGQTLTKKLKEKKK